MNINIITNNELTFSVERYCDLESSTGFEEFGKSVKTIEEAVNILNIAKITKPDNDWYIRCDVKTTFSKSEVR